MTPETFIDENREAILTLAQRHGARNVRVFGSLVRGEATSESDIDFLVDVGEETSPWFPAGFVEELEELLGRPVDVVTEDGLYWLLKRRILGEAKAL